MKLRSLALTAISLLIGFATFTFFRLVLDIEIEPDNTFFWFFLLFSILLVQFLLWIFEIKNIVYYLLWACILFVSLALVLPFLWSIFEFIFDFIWTIISIIFTALVCFFVIVFML